MTKYIVKDWAGNTMNWGIFDDFDDAMAELDEHVRQELLEDGLNADDQYSELNSMSNAEVYSGEYWIDEVTVNEEDFVELAPGIYLETGKSLADRQSYWADEDEDKSIDFTSSPYWLTTDSGDTPIPMASLQEALQLGLEEGWL